MRDNFTFTTGDNIVKTYLKTNEIKQIKTQQGSNEYTFEFHTGHETGYPIYIRPDGNKDTSNLPKFDTRNKSAGNYNTIKSFANYKKLMKELGNNAQTEILSIISTDWTRLQNLAKRYWESTPVSQVQVQKQQTTTRCKFCQGSVPLYIDPYSKKRKKAPCDTCGTFQ